MLHAHTHIISQFQSPLILFARQRYRQYMGDLRGHEPVIGRATIDLGHFLIRKAKRGRLTLTDHLRIFLPSNLLQPSSIITSTNAIVAIIVSRLVRRETYSLPTLPFLCFLCLIPRCKPTQSRHVGAPTDLPPTHQILS
jgi:hypothetical protein